jgi:phosphotransferase system HPr (HPr) family protein
MTEGKLARTVVIQNPQGLHARPADLFVKVAQQFESQVAVVKDNLRVDGKSILDILMLAAVQGTPLVIEATGTDAEAALAALCRLVEQNFAEGGNETGEAKN